ncbi:MAG: AI-2E family transporter [Anaerolineae bacterium]|nr:AI-2E family transporter [Anaerolineae bacterium]
MYVIIQQSESLFLVPRVMGNNLELHPFVVLLALISGAAVAGILGLILASPVVASMRLFLVYIWAKLVDADPFARQTPVRVVPDIIPVALPQGASPALGDPQPPAQQGEIVKE